MNRNSIVIMGTILELSTEKVNISTVVRKANIATDRAQTFIQKLTSSGLIVKIEKNWVITNRGRIYLEEYKKFQGFAESYGFDI